VRIWRVDGDGTGSAFNFTEVGAVQVLEDVEEAVDEEGVVLDDLVVLGDLAGARRRSCASMAFPKGGAIARSCAKPKADSPTRGRARRRRVTSSPQGERVAASAVLTSCGERLGLDEQRLEGFL
jgi:hypothetical protein